MHKAGADHHWRPLFVRRSACTAALQALSRAVFCTPHRILCASSHVDGALPACSLKFNHTNAVQPRYQPKESIMKAIKNLEALFLVAAATATFATYAVAEVPHRVFVKAPVVAVKAADVSGPVQVVVVKAKRLTAAEKAAL
jgi:hypothetical protein